MGGDFAFAQKLSELVRYPLGHAPSVDEHQSGAVLLHKLGDVSEHFGCLLVRSDSLQLGVGEVKSDVQVALVADVYYLARAVHADQQTGDDFQRPLGGGKADAGGRSIADVLQPFQAECQMAASFVASDCMYLIHDYGLGCAQHFTAAFGSQEQIKRLGGGYHKCRRILHGSHPLRLRSVARAHEHREVGRFKTELVSAFGDFSQRALQVFADVGSQGLERRDIDHLHLPPDIFAPTVCFIELVNGNQQRGQRFA